MLIIQRILRYKNYFTIATTGRVDKTSALPVGNNAFFYPSVSLSSVISDYVTMPEAITFLKVRGSFANVKDGGTQTYMSALPSSRSDADSPVGYGNSYYTPYDGPNRIIWPRLFIQPDIPIITKPGASAPTYVVDQQHQAIFPE